MTLIGLPDGVTASDLISQLLTVGMIVIPLLIPFTGWALYKRITRSI